MATLPARMRRVFRRELLILYGVVCLADVIVGLILPTFPLLAQRLGASVFLIGALSAINGGVQVLSGFPLGWLSDKRDRGEVIAGGAALLAVTAALLVVAPSPLWLVPAQITLGIGVVATFVMGGALAGSLSAPEDRGIVMGLFSTAMGIGFALGPLVGGLVSQNNSANGLKLAGSIAVISCVVALFGLRGRARDARPVTVVVEAPPPALWRNESLLFACAAIFLFTPIFAALITTFVPLHGHALGFSSLALGSVFTVRALASTSARLPTGLISTPRWSRALMMLALVLGGSAALMLTWVHTIPAFAAALALEGLSYGIFITAGQAFVSQHVERRELGAALGVYNTAGGISAATSPFVFGAIAAQGGVSVVFWYVGVLVLGGAAVLALLFFLRKLLARNRHIRYDTA